MEDFLQQMNDAVEGAPPSTPEDLAECEAARKRFNEMPAEYLRWLLDSLLSHILDNRDDRDGAVKSVDLYLMSEMEASRGGNGPGLKAAVIYTPTPGTSPCKSYSSYLDLGELQVFATDFSSGVELGHGITGNITDGLSAYPEAFFTMEFIIQYVDGRKECGIKGTWLDFDEFVEETE
jgi:hypothetical protein